MEQSRIDVAGLRVWAIQHRAKYFELINKGTRLLKLGSTIYTVTLTGHKSCVNFLTATIQLVTNS